MVTWTNTRAKCFCAWWHSQKYQSTSGGHVLLLKQVRTSRLEPHWGRVTHICVSRIIIIDSDNGLSPGRRQAIIWTNAGLLLIGPLGTNFSEILIEILTFSFKKMRLKVSSRPQCVKKPLAPHLYKLGQLDLCFHGSFCQWETTLHCNVVPHWLGAYTKLSSLLFTIFPHSYDVLPYAGGEMTSTLYKIS